MKPNNNNNNLLVLSDTIRLYEIENFFMVGAS